MGYYEKKFKDASSTGRSVVILKADGDCECFEKDSLINSEPNPRCKLCLGTGKHRVQIKTEEIRYELSTGSDGQQYEILDYTKSTSDVYSFFFPKHYSFIENSDIIVTFDDNGIPYTAFEVINKEKFVKNDFVYYEVFGRKITYLPLEMINGV